jgi:hypothetical protein
VKAVRLELDDAALRRYLLGLLPEVEADGLEEAYLARSEVLERVRAVEDDLLDDYASDRLGPGEKEAFESRYLASPLLRERVLVARALRLAAAERRVPAAQVVTARPTRWGAPLALAAGLVLAVAGLWMWPPRPPEVASAPVPPTSTARSETPSPPPSMPTGPSVAPASTPPRREVTMAPLVLALSPVLLRGQEQPVPMRLPAATDTVVLELEGDPALLPPSALALEAVVKAVEGGQVWRGEARRMRDARRPSLLASIRVPAARLVAGDYLLTLSARGTADGTLYSYFFRVGR